MRGDIATIKSDVAAIRDGLDQHQDELNVVSGLAMRATGERVGWSSVQAQLRKLTARIEALEQQGRWRRRRYLGRMT